MMTEIVLIDDDIITHSIVKRLLGEDFKLISSYTLKEAETYLQSANNPALVIIDRVLPDGDGIQLCSNIRDDERFSEVPIVFLTTKVDESDVVGGLFAGADDYISKSVSPLELKARIQARLRRKNKKLTFGKVSIDLATHRAMIVTTTETLEIDLTRIEFKLLVSFILAPDKVFSRDALITKIWGINSNLNDRVVDTHISHLRKKVDAAGLVIESIRGEGYRIALEQKTHAA